MANPRRPLSTRELLVETFRLYGQKFGLFVAVSIAGPAVLLLYQLLRVDWTSDLVHSRTAQGWLSIAGGIAFVLISMVAGMTLSLAATVRAVAAVSLGQEVRASEVYRALDGRFWRIVSIVASIFIRAFLGGVLLILLGMIALGLAASLGYNSREEAGAIGIACGSIAVAAAILAATGIYVRYSVAVQACLVEDIGRKLALKRRAFLIKGEGVRVASVFGVFMILALAMSVVLGAATLLPRGNGIAQQIAVAVAAFVVAALISPVGTISMSLIYYDERVRKEPICLLRPKSASANSASSISMSS